MTGGLTFYTRSMNFVWDSRKAAANLKKHKVSFEEGSTAFLDPLSITGADPDHSAGEHRWITFGISSSHRFLVISHTDEGETIRLISVREGTKREREFYEKG